MAHAAISWYPHLDLTNFAFFPALCRQYSKYEPKYEDKYDSKYEDKYEKKYEKKDSYYKEEPKKDSYYKVGSGFWTQPSPKP